RPSPTGRGEAVGRCRALSLSDLLFHQRGQELDIPLVGKSAAGVDVQSCVSVEFGQADLQDGQVTLQPRLLVNDEVDPSTPNASQGRRVEARLVSRLLCPGQTRSHTDPGRRSRTPYWQIPSRREATWCFDW